MADLAEGLEKWMKQLETATTLSVNDRAKITGAGATAYSEVLKKNTPRSDMNYTGKRRSVGHAKARKEKHLADSITFKPGWTIGKLNTGNTSVGFSDSYEAMVARFVNDGAGNVSNKRIANMHFKDKSEIEAKDAVLRAEAKEYKKVMHQ